MTRGYASVSLQKDQPVLRQRRRRRGEVSRPDRVKTDFWKHFDLEKFAMDWRPAVGTTASSR